MTVFAGGSTVSATIADGTESVLGTATATSVGGGGTAIVSAGGVASATLANFGGRCLRSRGQVSSDMAWDAGLDLIEHRYCGANLAGCAVAALIAVMLHESRLHRV